MYEAFPDLAQKLGATKLDVEDGTPLCLRWETPSARGPSYEMVVTLLSTDVVGFHVHLMPSHSILAYRNMTDIFGLLLLLGLG